MTNKKYTFFLFFFAILFISKYIYAQADTSILVGVAYFAGWHEEEPSANKWIMYPWWEPEKIDFTQKGNEQWAGREPMLGKYNVQATMDAEIIAAAKYGVDFFCILWYYSNNAPEEKRTTINRLNRGLEQYLVSPNKNRMKFMMEACNADGNLSVTSEAGWDSIANVFVDAAKDPSYLRIDGRPVFKIHDASRFYTQLNRDITRCQNVIQNIRSKARDAGLGEIMIAVGTYGDGQIGPEHTYTKYGVDFTMQYAGLPLSLPVGHYPYSTLTDYVTSLREIRKGDALNWVPYTMSSWDVSPWSGDTRHTFDFPTREEWTAELESVKRDLLNSTTLGFPKKDGTTQKAFTIYAWNEFGEGGIVAPTEGDQYMKLECIKDVFGGKTPSRIDTLIIYETGQQITKLAIDDILRIEYQYIDPTSVEDADGNIYTSIKIGEQEWLNKNLITTSFNNGDPITYVSDDADWINQTAPAFGWYEGNAMPWGSYYNQAVIRDARALCPTGYHIPSQAEFETLVSGLGDNVCAQLKSTTNWNTPGTNSSGFDAPGSSLRDSEGVYKYQKLTTFLWTTTVNASDGTFNIVFRINDAAEPGFQGNGHAEGFPVRCIKDAQ
jgi:uncharacterized protein (TIGR02145 family)